MLRWPPSTHPRRQGGHMSDLRNRWVSASSTPGAGIEVKVSTIPGFVVVREVADERPCVFVSDGGWSAWRQRVVSGEYVPATDPVTGEVVLAISDCYIGGVPMHPIRTSRHSYEEFERGCREGVFDRLPPYIPATPVWRGSGDPGVSGP